MSLSAHMYQTTLVCPETWPGKTNVSRVPFTLACPYPLLVGWCRAVPTLPSCPHYAQRTPTRITAARLTSKQIPSPTYVVSLRATAAPFNPPSLPHPPSLPQHVLHQPQRQPQHPQAALQGEGPRAANSSASPCRANSSRCEGWGGPYGSASHSGEGAVCTAWRTPVSIRHAAPR